MSQSLEVSLFQQDWCRFALSSIGDAAIICDTEGRVTFLNPLAESFTGWTLHAAAGVPRDRVFRVVNEESRQPPVENNAVRALRDGVAIRLANHSLLIAKDGTERPIDGNAAPIRNDQGEVTGLVLVFRDISERRREEAAIQASEARYRRLFETAKDGILILDVPTGKIIDANPFICGLLGYEHDEFLSKELWQLGLFQDIEASRTAFRTLRELGYVRYENLPLETKSGRQVEVEFVSNVYEVDERQVAQCNVRDITDRSRMERQMQEQANELKDLHRRKDEFLAMLSHELRNPLAPILNAMHLLRLRGDDKLIQQQARGIIERQVGQLVRLVDDLLEVSRITTGKVHLCPERTDLRGVIENAKETVGSLIDSRRQELFVSLPSEPIWLHADPTRLEQVVVNLLNNGAKFTDEGGQIWLTLRREGDAAVLRLRDTGVGIAPHLLNGIFELFTQAARSLDRSQGGLGIGLWLVQQIVEMHGGVVEAQSDGLGRGSEFIVRLPMLLSPELQPPSNPTESTEQPAHPCHVLVVDDNVDTAESISMLLRASGHDVRTAYAGPSALTEAVTYHPNVVLLDIGLPGMNGYEVARRLRQDPQLKDARLVAVSGYGLESDIHRSQEAGFDAHMVKPIDPKKLREILTTTQEREHRMDACVSQPRGS
jgi:PAS domain S-box-containing protein